MLPKEPTRKNDAWGTQARAQHAAPLRRRCGREGGDLHFIGGAKRRPCVRIASGQSTGAFAGEEADVEVGEVFFEDIRIDGVEGDGSADDGT